MQSSELLQFAADQQRRFDSATSPEERKERGHFGTPPVIAQFMADMFSAASLDTVRVLDAGAGVGILSAAICQTILTQSRRQSLFFELWENDERLNVILNATMSRCQQRLHDAGHKMEFVVKSDDFILSNSRQTLFKTQRQPSFHLAILNPPYFKLRKESPQAQAMSHVVHGQPNIYALFMAGVVDLLLPQGEMVAITPRSYFNGPYFKRFRKWFFDRMTAKQIHLFQSRTEAFRDGAVLQENVILHAIKDGKPSTVVLTNSYGRELTKVDRNCAPYDKVIDSSNGDHVVRVTIGDFEHEIMEAVDSLPIRFRNLGFEVSTGPVVTFRFAEFLRHHRSRDTAPLLWMHNVRPFITQFPEKNGKPTHIKVSNASKKLLIPAKTYVLLKRFTAKEEKRRLVAGVLRPSDSYSEWIGLENHLNYVYRQGADLTKEEAFGLAAFFNSALVDKYFRAISGSTQVNATEIRAMPLPDRSTLMEIGSQIQQLKARDHATVEDVVCQSLGLPQHLIKQLVQVA